jgi:hypothetical protein
MLMYVMSGRYINVHFFTQAAFNKFIAQTQVTSRTVTLV